MELALTHWREKMGSNWQPGLGWIKGGEGTPQGIVFLLSHIKFGFLRKFAKKKSADSWIYFANFIKVNT